MSKVHVIGAGMAGLSCALRLAEAGRKVSLYEAGPRAGGRCRSYHDDKLGCVIDNGNHLILSGNHAVRALLRATGADESEILIQEARYPFLDLQSDARWAIRLSEGRFPGWVFDAEKRVPDTGARDYFSLLRVILAGAGATVGALVPKEHPLYRSFWEPLTLAVLNTPPDEAAASLLRPVFLETFAKGAAFSRPILTRHGLAAALVEPTLALLTKIGCDIAFGSRLRAIGTTDNSVAALDFGGETVALSPGDAAVLAVPPEAAKSLLPGLSAPDRYRTILNVHFRLPDRKAPAPRNGFMGLLGGLSQWVFFRDDLASVTVSAADEAANRPTDELAGQVWEEVARAIDAETRPCPPFRIIKEKRATFAQTPDQIVRRPKCRTALANLFLAGDWTDTGLPATIEGAVRSGETAARAILDGPAS